MPNKRSGIINDLIILQQNVCTHTFLQNCVLRFMIVLMSSDLAPVFLMEKETGDQITSNFGENPTNMM